MFVDFILFWSITLTVLRLGMSGLLLPETAGTILFALAVIIAIARRFGSTVWRDRVRLPKFLFALALFGWTFSQGTWDGAIQAISMSAAVPIALTGLFMIVRGPPKS